MIYLREIQFNPNPKGWAIDLPAFKKLQKLDFNSSITFFVGENGSGKSTLMEAIAYLCNFNVLGGSQNTISRSGAESDLPNNLKFVWAKKINKGFFLRAESFFNYATYLDDLYKEMSRINSPEMLNVYRSYGGESLNKQSHGETFRSLTANRFRWPGIYLLDEPEAALSPQNQLVFLSYLYQYQKDSQFIIATHSPILMAFPNAQIFNFDVHPLRKGELEEMEHFQLTKNFLNNPESYLHHLFSSEEE